MDRTEIAYCLELCNVAYMTWHEAQNFADLYNATLVKTIHNKTAHAYVFWREETLYVAIRGTEFSEIMNVLMDIGICPARTKYGRAHRGFIEWADLLWPEIVSLLESIAQKPSFQTTRVVFVGHSAGGAAATHLAMRSANLVKQITKRKPDLVTAGSPMVGTAGFGRAVKRHTECRIRITNNNDPIPHCIAWPMYQHADSTRLHVTGDLEILRNPTRRQLLADIPHGFWKFFVRFVKVAFQRRSILEAVIDGLNQHDHRLDNYRAAFRQ